MTYSWTWPWPSIATEPTIKQTDRPYGAFFYVPTFRLFDSVKKTITIPENLYDITVDQYIQVKAIPEGDEMEQVVRTICILCHLERAEVMAMEQKDIQHIGGVIGGILDKYDEEYPVERIIELDQRYGFHPNLSRVTVAEFADIETLCKDSFDTHLPQVMGILYRPIVEEHGEFYRIADYDGEDRSEFFKEMKLAHALGAAAFFLRECLDMRNDVVYLLCQQRQTNTQRHEHRINQKGNPYQSSI